MYRGGVGIAPDNAKAYIWFNLAAAQDVAGAAVQRDAALRTLAPEQIVEAQAEARRLSEAAAARQASEATAAKQAEAGH
jgi:TPR repeat protein